MKIRNLRKKSFITFDPRGFQSDEKFYKIGPKANLTIRNTFRTHAPFCYALSLFISGTFFARKMRDARYLTMIDPFTQKFGRWGALQALPAAVGEIFWCQSYKTFFPSH
jgi:hypothetical protein